MPDTKSCSPEGGPNISGRREALAAYAHDAWSGWMRYLFDKSGSPIDSFGTVVIPRHLVDRWKRQMETPYSELTNEEKMSDRKEADKILDIVMNWKDET